MKRRVKQNVWGNWKGYEGTKLAYDFGTDEQDALAWAAGGELPKFNPDDWVNKIGPVAEKREADRIDGYDRDDLGESNDY